jgi:hypothetical protein
MPSTSGFVQLHRSTTAGSSIQRTIYEYQGHHKGWTVKTRTNTNSTNPTPTKYCKENHIDPAQGDTYDQDTGTYTPFKKPTATAHKTKTGHVKQSTYAYLESDAKTTRKDIINIWEDVHKLFDPYAIVDMTPLPANTTAPTHPKGRPKVLNLTALLQQQNSPGWARELSGALAQAIPGDRGTHGNGEGKLPIYAGASPYTEASFFKGGGRLVVDTAAGSRYISLHYHDFYRVI